MGTEMASLGSAMRVVLLVSSLSLLFAAETTTSELFPRFGHSNAYYKFKHPGPLKPGATAAPRSMSPTGNPTYEPMDFVEDKTYTADWRSPDLKKEFARRQAIANRHMKLINNINSGEVVNTAGGAALPDVYFPNFKGSKFARSDEANSDKVTKEQATMGNNVLTAITSARNGKFPLLEKKKSVTTTQLLSVKSQKQMQTKMEDFETVNKKYASELNKEMDTRREALKQHLAAVAGIAKAGMAGPYVTKHLTKHLPDLKKEDKKAKPAKKKVEFSLTKLASTSNDWKFGLDAKDIVSDDSKAEMAKRKASLKKHLNIMQNLTKSGEITQHLQQPFTWKAEKSKKWTEMLAQMWTSLF